MSWDSTILAICTEELELSSVVSDVFMESEDKISFEDASSASLGVNLAACKFQGWTFVFDSWHRIGNHQPFLQELSAKNEVLIFRIGDEPRFSRWRAGKCIIDTQDVDGMRADLDRMQMAPNRPDPESVSQAMFQAMTGIAFPFKDAEFSLFTLG